ncbi:hypothetical protein LZ30DRAFT_786842 [Colletotrichum cereale]|nr:hypothetical protein LZ30DRAFT_786842 [Colletotrichum cereale]
MKVRERHIGCKVVVLEIYDEVRVELVNGTKAFLAGWNGKRVSRHASQKWPIPPHSRDWLRLRRRRNIPATTFVAVAVDVVAVTPAISP